MRLQTILALALLALPPGLLFAGPAAAADQSKSDSAPFNASAGEPSEPDDRNPDALKPETYGLNQAIVDKLEGTIMVQHPDGSEPTALETGSTIQKGDTLTVYDQSWVIFKTHKGDRIGLDGNTVMGVDEYDIQGPDRQIRLVLQKGTLLLKTNGCGSRQSFFEIDTGGVVTSINDVHAILSYDPKGEKLKVQHLVGKLEVIDKQEETKFTANNSENTWADGKASGQPPQPVDEIDGINFNKFFNGEPRVSPPSNEFLLSGND
jgi:hypothetical protein